MAYVTKISPGKKSFSLTFLNTFAFPFIFPYDTVSPINSFLFLDSFFGGEKNFPRESNIKGFLFHDKNIFFDYRNLYLLNF